MRAWFSQFGDYRTALTWRQMCGVLMNQLLLTNQGWFDCCPTRLFEELDNLPESKHTLADFIDHVYRFHGDHVGATFRQWGDKTPANINNVKEILRIFPHARFVFMLREPVDVVYSWTKHRDYLGETERPALRWKRAFRNGLALERQYPAQVVRVHYENLVMQTSTEMQRITQFLGTQYDASYITREEHFGELSDAQNTSHLANALNGISQDSLGKGRREMTPAQLQVLRDCLGDSVTEAGYASLER